jgi:tRNA threonylcarbamoyladenosine biosynthesis protein TsaE
VVLSLCERLPLAKRAAYTGFMLTMILNDERDTDRLGAALAEALPPRTVVGLNGTLGAGKTRLVQAVASAFGLPPQTVTSPTFVLVNEYKGGRMPIYHFDTYRLKDDDEFLNLGPDEYFDADGITFVEWANRVSELLPTERLEITIDVTGKMQRSVSIRGTSSRIEVVARRIAESMDKSLNRKR